MENQECLVAISCITYNHKDYLRQCLDGFVMQKTNFRYVAVVHDDCSTDGTTDILREYAARYPDIIWPIYEEENQYSKHNGEIGRKLNEAFNRSGAKYIACCEGDDYWIDLYKLQKQVDYMEAHPDVGLCYTDCKVFLEKENLFFDSVFKDRAIPMSETQPVFDSLKSYAGNLTWLYRRSIVEQIPPNPGYKDGALYLLYSICERAKLGYLPDVTGVYRRHEGSASFIPKNEKERRFQFDKSTLLLYWQFAPKFGKAQEALRKIMTEDLCDAYYEALMRNDEEIISIYHEFYKDTIDFKYFDMRLKNLKSAQNSKAYQLGKKILYPFNKIKMILGL